MTRKSRNLIGLMLLVLMTLAAIAWLLLKRDDIGTYTESPRPAAIYPDYSAAVIPPNIAPLNLKIQEVGQKFCLRLSSGAAAPSEIFSTDGSMQIPPVMWRRLLDANKGGELLMDIFVKGDRGWLHFDTMRNRIAADEIDPYVVYRFIPPIYNKWDRISLIQRDLRSFDEHALIDTAQSTDGAGKNAEGACVNCHTFLNRGTDQMLIQMRPGQSSQIPAMILVREGKATKVDTRYGAIPPAAYASWHPGGKLLAFSRNRIIEMFHSAGAETRVVVDRDSDLGLYRVDTGRAYAVPQISRPDRLETFPSWSPDGRYLYFSSARLTGMDKKDVPLNYDQMRYDLERVAYNPETDRWGEVETVVAANQIGKSISLPEVSPDGRYLLFCGHDYGSFPTYQPGSDLYLLDLCKVASEAAPSRSRGAGPAAGGGQADPARLIFDRAALRKLDEINSDRAESYHSWSSNGRWIIFASKREDGMFARLYLAHLEVDGSFGKPVLMPQRDPLFYSVCLMTFNRPELIRQPVTVTAAELVRAMNSVGDKVTGEDPPAGKIR